MIKITYLENEIRLEHLTKSTKIWKSDRILLNLRAGISVYTESGVGSLIFPVTSSSIENFAKLAEADMVYVNPCDREYVEVSLLGTWIAESQDSEEGIFACDLSHEKECLLYQLWQESFAEASVVSE